MPQSAPSPTTQSSAPPPDQWTLVKPKRGRTRPKRVPIPVTSSRAEPLRSTADITAEYTRLKPGFSSSLTLTSLDTFISDRKASCHAPQKAICLGIGSFDPPNGAWEAKRTAYTQLFAFEHLVAAFDLPREECVFQEPLFTEGDAAFLRGLGYTVVKTGATDLVNTHTLLFGVHLYRDLYEEALRGAMPAMFVGTDWQTWDKVLEKDHGLQSLRRMDETWAKWMFPQEGTAFSSTCLYWRGEGGE